MSRYVLHHISEFIVDFPHGDAGVILRPRATCHSSSGLLWLPGGRVDFALVRAQRERGRLANFAEKTWIFGERKKEWSVNALC